MRKTQRIVGSMCLGVVSAMLAFSLSFIAVFGLLAMRTTEYAEDEYVISVDGFYSVTLVLGVVALFVGTGVSVALSRRWDASRTESEPPR